MTAPTLAARLRELANVGNAPLISLGFGRSVNPMDLCREAADTLEARTDQRDLADAAFDKVTAALGLVPEQTEADVIDHAKRLVAALTEARQAREVAEQKRDRYRIAMAHEALASAQPASEDGARNG